MWTSDHLDLLSTRYGLFFTFFIFPAFYTGALMDTIYFDYLFLLTITLLASYNPFTEVFWSGALALGKSLDLYCSVYSVFSSHYSAFYVLCLNDHFLEFCHYMFLMNPKGVTLQISTQPLEEHPQDDHEHGQGVRLQYQYQDYAQTTTALSSHHC